MTLDIGNLEDRMKERLRPWEIHYRRPEWQRTLLRSRGEGPVELRRWIPSDYVMLATAIDMLGKRDLPGWTGLEKSARPDLGFPDPPWAWEGTVFKPSPHFIVSPSGEVLKASETEAENWWKDILPVLRNEMMEENSARQRWELCQSQMRSHLSTEKIVAFTISILGDKKDIDRQSWLNEELGFQLLESGISKIWLEYDMTSPSGLGPVLLKKNFLFGIAVEGITVLATVPSEASIRSMQMHFPYLAFMMSAVADASFPKSSSQGKRVPKKIIEDWLEANWPSDLGPISSFKLTNMATFLRKPEDETGGNSPRADS